MTRFIAVLWAACAALASCSHLTDSKRPRLVSASVVLTNALRTSSARPGGVFASVLDSVTLTVRSRSGEVLATDGYKLRAYDSTASLSVNIPAGDATFDVQVLSNNRTVLFTGSTPANVTNDEASIAVNLAPVRPVLLVLPDTAKSTTVTTMPFTVYNAGNAPLNVSIASIDTALIRCAAACSLTLGTSSVGVGQTTIMRPTVSPNFPSRLFSFVLRSAEGDVTVYWQYTGFSITSVTVQPTTALLTIGQAMPFSANVQTVGAASTTVTWSSANPALVSVNAPGVPTGTAIGVARGLTNVVATSTFDPSKTGTAAVRVYSPTDTASNWTISVADTTSISRDGVGRRDTVRVIAKATGITSPTNTYPNPFALVEFWARAAAGGPWRRISQAPTTTVTDVGQLRTWAWTLIWNPDANDVPFANPSSTRMTIIAIGVAANGQATTTAANPLITVFVP